MPASQSFGSPEPSALQQVYLGIERLTSGRSEIPTPGEAKRYLPRYEKIVVAYDGSDGAELALAWAEDLARDHGSAIHVASVLTPPVVSPPAALGHSWYPDYAEVYEALERSLRVLARDAAAHARDAGLDATPHVLTGSVVHEIVKLARAERASLVVAGASRQGVLGLRLGAVASGLVGQAPCSVLVARGPPRPARILVATDGSPDAARAVAHAMHRHDATGAHLIVEHVLERPLPAPFRERVEEEDAPERVTYVLDAGDPASRILGRAGREDVGLIVLGAHGASALERFLLGSTSRRVARAARCSVLVVKEDPLP